ncbi:dUTPase-like protein [Dinothrombium tinctorium]|uniref:Deoxyuridine 5'-triphosphate nucleotidohydrolase n=1 Tax=Dinothrombium tinctorium TaxID=1965070 RepID=A0A3S3RHS8_9ACAR|nr:dUTPase-like protein [Dinothrombium tinctorium]
MSLKPILKVKKITENAHLPQKCTEFSAGFDLFSAYDYVVNPKTRILIKTDLQFEFPENCYGRIAPRSSLASKFSIDIGAGVIDADFRGNVCVVFINNGKKKFDVKKGMRIAQIICEKYESPQIVEVDCLNKTERNEQGFGSTGL